MGSAAAAPSGTLAFVDAGSITQSPAIKHAYTSFGQKYPKIHVNVAEYSGIETTFDTDVKTRMSAGVETDLINLNGQFVVAWARSRLIYPLSEFAELQPALHSVDPGSLRVAAYEGVPYVLPLAATGGLAVTVLWYNRDLTKTVGLPAAKTLADLKAMVAPLAKVGASPMVHPAGEETANQLLIMWILPQVVGGDQAVSYVLDTMKGIHKYTAAPSIETWSIMNDLVTSKVMLPGSGSVHTTELPELLMQGKAAATYNGTWDLSLFSPPAPMKGYDLQLTSLPVLVPNATPRPIVADGGYTIPRVSKNVDAAIALMKYMAQASVDKTITAATQSLSPMDSSNSVITSPLTRGSVPYFKDAITPYDWLWEPQVTTVIGEQAQAIFLGSVTPKEAAANVEAAFQTLVKTGKSFFPQQ